MICLLVIMLVIILLIYFGNLRGEWNKPNERSAAITFKDFLTLLILPKHVKITLKK